VLIYVFMAVILGLVVLKTPFSIKSASKIVAGLFHLGLFITMTTATLGNADMQRMRMIVAKGEPEWRVMDQQGYVKEMPLAIELQEFIMETYDDGSPRRFASKIEILTQEGKKYHATVDVNKPAEVEGWKIYQYGYDTQAGAQSNISILELVSDPWLPYVYIGIFLMLGGGLLMFITGMRRKEEQA
jgi:cytochrome c biogenesis factor